tara:strand:- start:6567 stop:6881 length:315 start_codon:yes stop_codon:yes gene_type:complete
MASAQLTEPGVKNWIRYALYLQKQKNDKVSNAMYNLCMLVVLVVGVGGFLYYRYSDSQDCEARSAREQKREKYIIDKLQRLAAVQSNKGMITSLPTFDDFVSQK